MEKPSIFAVTPTERRYRACADLRIGLPVVVTGKDGLWLALAAERAAPDRVRAVLDGADAQLVLTRWRAETLRMRVYDDDLVRLPLARDTRPDWIDAMIDPSADLASPMKGPFFPLRDGDATAQRAVLGLLKQVEFLPAALMMRVESAPPGIVVLDANDAAPSATSSFRESISARLPIAATPETRLHVFRADTGSSEHYAVEIGKVDRHKPVLTRLHSACFTGDVLGSLKCDCGPQLEAALAQMAAAGSGLLLYLNQEGRGIGLANKMRAYALQDQGFDTVTANNRLGFDDDERDFSIGAAILGRLGIGQIRLLTNNPRKLEVLRQSGIEIVERVPLWVGETAHNRDYLRIKSERSGHLE